MNTDPMPDPGMIDWESVPKMADCRECFGDGWVFLDLGQCGDPECCGSPVKARCPYCDSTWSDDDG